MALKILIGLVLLYGVVCVAARVLYPRILFPAPRIDVAPVVDGARLVTFAQADGSHTSALHYPAPTGARTVVYFHGNGESIFDDVDLADALVQRGFGVLLVEYRGYGVTHGPPPTEASLYDDGEAAIRWLRDAGNAEERIALWGQSLGTSVAAEMASRGHGARIVLVSPFTSIVAVGKTIAPFLPVSLLMKHRLDTLSKAPRIAQPALIVHGEADELVPFAMGKTLAQALPHAELVPVAVGHHNDLFADRDRFVSLLDRIAKHLGEQ